MQTDTGKAVNTKDLSAEWSKGDEDVVFEGDAALKTMEMALEKFSGREEGFRSNIFGTLKEWTHLTAGDCRRNILDQYSDGTSAKTDCRERSLALCDLCKKRSERKQHTETGKGRGRVIRRSGQRSMTTTTKKGGINLISSDDSGESADFGYKTLITPPMTKRRMSFGRNEVGGPSTAHASSRVLVSPNPSMSQSQNVGSEGVKEMATYFDVLCALCSVKERNEIWHGNRNQQDDQSCTEYKKHCFKCGSSKNISRSCFTINFKEQSKSGQFGKK